jgi:Asp-tRNA(Asn)/Glu-tRNA(Gln) amidotransferase A subunit family amidase
LKAARDLTASEAVTAIRDGRLTALALTEACLERIALREPAIHAWAALDREVALAQARRADANDCGGSLHGVPIGIKDVIDTQDFPTAYGSPLYAGFRPAADAHCVRCLRAAGAVIIGKTETVEFAAAGRVPPTRNPRGLDHTPGGSSSGSAAAVADGMAPVTLGTQTGGSVIRPAAFTGIFALKPSFGAVPTDGVKTYAPSLDTVGWMARSIADLDRVAEAFGLPQGGDRPRTSTLRIGVLRGPHWDKAAPEARFALECGAQQIAADFATLDLAFAEFENLTEAQETIMYHEGAASFGAEAREVGERMHPSLRAIATNLRGITAEACAKAYQRVASCRRAFEARIREASCDAVLTLASTGEAPEGIGYTGDALFNKMWSALGVPCLAIPYGTGPRGLPTGLQLVGRHSTDRRLLAIGQILADRLGTSRPSPRFHSERLES